MKLLLTIPVAVCLSLVLAACEQKERAAPTPPARPAPASPLQAPLPPVAPPSPATETREPTASVPARSLENPAPKPTAAPAAAPTAKPKDAAGLDVRRLVLASRIVEREPEAATLPRVGDPLLAFVEARNSAAESEKLIVTFEHESGTKVGFVELSVPAGAKRWRTWARTHNVNEPGRWEAVVRSESGRELGRTAFTVTAS